MFKHIGRRTFLQAAGVSIALPFLESMSNPICAAEAKTGPRRMVAIGTPFGFDPQSLIPTTTGKDYALTQHLEHLKDLKNDFTIITGLNHPSTGGGGHKAEAVMLTGAPYPDYSHNLHNTISIDQEFATRFRGQTRYDSLVLTTYNGSLSYTGNGVAIPPISRPSEIFSKLFLASTPQQATEELRRIGEGRSMLDFVSEQANRLSKKVSTLDRARLDEYYESVRSVERQLQMSAEWVNKPKPKAPCAPPVDINSPGEQFKKLQLMFDMIHLALVTDSTRAITIKTFGDHHDLSHHGKEAKKLAACRDVETELMKGYASLMTKLKTSKEGDGGSLLDTTMVLMTSNLMDGNSHSTYNLPVLLGGGGFKHGQHLTFNQGFVEYVAKDIDSKTPKPIPTTAPIATPLCNVYVSMLQRAGVETNVFGSSNGRLTGLEMN
jgi:hypothetical protein